MAGENGDRSQLGEYLQKNVALNKFRSGLTASVHGTASFIRSEMARNLRKSPYQVNMLIGGYSEKEGSKLYVMDYLASMVETPFGAQGHGANFILSVLDRHWKPDMNLEEGKALMRLCIEVLQTRFLINQRVFVVKSASASGIDTVDVGIGHPE